MAKNKLSFSNFLKTFLEITEIEDKILKEIMEFCGSNLGYITYGDKPPLNSEEFIEIMKK